MYWVCTVWGYLSLYLLWCRRQCFLFLPAPTFNLLEKNDVKTSRLLMEGMLVKEDRMSAKERSLQEALLGFKKAIKGLQEIGTLLLCIRDRSVILSWLWDTLIIVSEGGRRKQSINQGIGELPWMNSAVSLVLSSERCLPKATCHQQETQQLNCCTTIFDREVT